MAVLYAPEAYHKLSEFEKKEICNGCGAKSGISSWLVPNTLYGLSVKAACNIHDYMYFVGTTNADKEEADRVFLNNMMRIINQDGAAWLAALRRRRALKYYEAVYYGGGEAFWKSKNAPGTMKYVGAN